MKDRLRLALALALLAGIFGYSCWRVFSWRRAEQRPGHVTLRIGHWLLHAGMREAFAEAAAEYEKLHPGVTVEQVTVPVRVWPTWLRTQLVGGTAPDITGLYQTNEELISRYFLPITDRIREHNPYNAGSPLVGMPWQETFVDGLALMRNYTATSGEICGVYLQLNSLRLFYNKTLLREVTGSDTPPSDYAELRALAPSVAAYNERTGRRIAPIAGCGPYSQFLFNYLLPSQTQKLAVKTSPMRTLTVPLLDLAALVIDGEVTYRDPEFQASIGLLQDVTSLMTPGFMQLQRDDALFAFLQGHAVAVCAGSWDYAVFLRDGDFPVTVSRILLPSPDDPEYGRFVLGQMAEWGGNAEAMFGIVRTSRHPEVALDFLKFLTSYRMAGMFGEYSRRMSSIVGIPPPADAPELAPRADGEVNGFPIDFPYGGGHANRIFQNNLHLLLGPRGDREAFTRAVETEIPAALKKDVSTHLRYIRRDIRRLDALVGLLLTAPPEDVRDERQWARLLENRHMLQADYLRYRRLAEE